jgi:hypothetical protein
MVGEEKAYFPVRLLQKIICFNNIPTEEVQHDTRKIRDLCSGSAEYRNPAVLSRRKAA